MNGERDTVAGTVEEPGTEIIFECFDLQRNRRLREKQVLRCFAEAEMLGNCTKDLQPKIFELSHGVIIYAQRILSPGDVQAGVLCFQSDFRFLRDLGGLFSVLGGKKI